MILKGIKIIDIIKKISYLISNTYAGLSVGCKLISLNLILFLI